MSYNNGAGQYATAHSCLYERRDRAVAGPESVVVPGGDGGLHFDRAGQFADQRTLYEKRSNQLDVRFSKIFTFGRSRVQGNLDVFNMTNSDDVLLVQNRYGSPNGGTGQALNTLPGRMFKVSAQWDF